MIINTDDIKYVMTQAYWIDIPAIQEMLNCQTIAEMEENKEYHWAIYLINSHIIRFVLLNIMSPPSDNVAMLAYYLFCYTDVNSDYPELEEQIRTDKYWRNLYEKETGKKI